MEWWRSLAADSGGAALLRAADRLLFPASCFACDEVEFEPGRLAGLCAGCVASLPIRAAEEDAGGGALEVGRRRFAQVVVALRYRPPVDELVLRLKYGQLELAAVPLADALSEAVARAPRFERPDFLAPLPMHWLKRWLRGGDHADWLVERLGARLDLRVVRVLRRARPTRAQGGAQSLRERVRHVTGAFRVRGDVRGRHVALVDDVVTSGATAATAARALLRAGARAVSLLAVAGNGQR
jgi:ComF family protein